MTVNHKLVRQGRDRRRRLARDVEARSQRSRESSIASQVDAFRESFRSSRSSLASAALANDPSQQAFNDNEQEGSFSTQVARPQTFPRAATFSMSIVNQADVMNGLANITPFSPSQARTSRRTRDSIASSALSMTSPSMTSTSRHDTTRSTYFKLKALGLDPNSTTLHTTNNTLLAATTNDRKRPRTASFGTSMISGKRLTTASASPLARSTYLPDETIASLDSPAAMPQPANIDDDDELLVAARQVRQAMTESISLFQEEIAKDEVHQSQSSKAEPLTRLSKSLGAQDWRATVASFTSLAPAPSTERTSKFVEPAPRYRNRVSKFLPRDLHGDVQAARRRTIGTRLRGGTPNPVRETALEVAVAEQSFVNGVKSAKDEPILLDDDDDDIQILAKDAISPLTEESYSTQPMPIDPQLTQFGPVVNGSPRTFSDRAASMHSPPQVSDSDSSYPVVAGESHHMAQPAVVPASNAVSGRPHAPEAASSAIIDNNIMITELPTPARVTPAVAPSLQPTQSDESPVKSPTTQLQLLSQAPPQKAETLDPRKTANPPAASQPAVEPSPPSAVTQDSRERPYPPPPPQVLPQASTSKPAPRDPRQRSPPPVAPQPAPKAAPQKAPTRDPRQRPAPTIQSLKLKMQPKPPPRRQVSAPHVNSFALLEGMGDDDDEDEDEENGDDDENEAAGEDMPILQNPRDSGTQNDTFVAANDMQLLQAAAKVHTSGNDDKANGSLHPSQLSGGMWDQHDATAKDEAGYAKYFSESEDDGEGEGYEYDDAGMRPGGEMGLDDEDEGEAEDEEDEDDGEDEEDEEEEFDEDDESMEEDDEDEPQGRARVAAWGAANGGKSGASVEDAIEL